VRRLGADRKPIADRGNSATPVFPADFCTWTESPRFAARWSLDPDGVTDAVAIKAAAGLLPASEMAIVTKLMQVCSGAAYDDTGKWRRLHITVNTALISAGTHSLQNPGLDRGRGGGSVLVPHGHRMPSPA
jgi:hypothetical protein